MIEISKDTWVNIDHIVCIDPISENECNVRTVAGILPCPKSATELALEINDIRNLLGR